MFAAPAVAGAAGLRTAITNSSFNGSDGPLSAAYPHVAETGASAIRIYLSWAGTAPRARPASWDPTNPDDPNYFWYIDDQVRAVRRAGLLPIITVSDAPTWAERSSGGQGGTNDPDPEMFAQFMRAAARRYNGSSADLPVVRNWQIWNEPNAAYFFNPQRRNGRNVSPELYRSLVNAGASAVRGVSSANRVIAGGTYPFTQTAAGSEAIGARRFFREVTSKPVQFDIWSIHPYTSGNAFHKAFRSGEDASMGDLPAVRRDLDSVVRTGRIKSRGKPELWVTEFSWDSSPPDPKGVPTDLLTRWTSEALYQAWRAKVTLFTWFQLRDNPLGAGSQGGLFARCGRPECYRAKPNLRAFRFPLVAYRRGSSVQVWGRTPRGKRGSVVVEQQRGGGWTRLASVKAASDGVFTGSVRPRGSGAVRARLGDDSSAAFSLRVPPDRPGTTPFGS